MRSSKPQTLEVTRKCKSVLHYFDLLEDVSSTSSCLRTKRLLRGVASDGIDEIPKEVA
jgi:hypothetical protein